MRNATPELLMAIAVTAEACGRTFSEAAARQFAADLSAYPQDKVLAALHRCRMEVKTFLTPAHVFERISDDRLGADEAWARALTGQDESETIITTPEIMAAFSIAQTVLETGDDVGARMAFKDAYNRIVSEARAAGKPVEWQASLGWNAEKRARVVNQAVAAGFLPAPKAAALLPPPKPKTQDVYPEGLARVKAMMATLTPKREQLQRAREAESAADRERTAAAKQQAEEMTREHEKKSAPDFAKNPTHAASF